MKLAKENGNGKKRQGPRTIQILSKGPRKRYPQRRLRREKGRGEKRKTRRVWCTTSKKIWGVTV